jgi:hypothetical protein
VVGRKTKKTSKAFMKKLCMIVVGICAVGLLMPVSLSAAKADGPKAKAIAKYDKNSNGVLDPDEKKAMQDDYAKDNNGELKAFDKDGDGKLSDEELAAIKPGSGKAKEGATKSKKKSTETSPDNDASKKEGDADKSQDKPADKPAEKPAEKPADKPSDKPDSEK